MFDVNSWAVLLTRVVQVEVILFVQLFGVAVIYGTVKRVRELRCERQATAPRARSGGFPAAATEQEVQGRQCGEGTDAAKHDTSERGARTLGCQTPDRAESACGGLCTPYH